MSFLGSAFHLDNGAFFCLLWFRIRTAIRLSKWTNRQRWPLCTTHSYTHIYNEYNTDESKICGHWSAISTSFYSHAPRCHRHRHRILINYFVSWLRLHTCVRGLCVRLPSRALTTDLCELHMCAVCVCQSCMPHTNVYTCAMCNAFAVVGAQDEDIHEYPCWMRPTMFLLISMG